MDWVIFSFNDWRCRTGTAARSELREQQVPPIRLCYSLLAYRLPASCLAKTTSTIRRYWFDNEQDRSPQAEAMYLEELREFRAFLVANTAVDELRNLNLLGVR